MEPIPKEPELYDPSRGGEALRVREIHVDGIQYEPSRTNYFAVYRMESGEGTIVVDNACHRFGPRSLICMVPYQYVRFECDQPMIAGLVEFHANFLCVETFHAEVGCAGRVFNDPYGIPVISLDEASDAEMSFLFGRITGEQIDRKLAFAEASLAYLKVLLIHATRLKVGGDSSCQALATSHRHPVLSNLSILIEEHYRNWHSPAEYAKALCVTPKTLGRLVREHLGTTPTDLIRKRILTHAKWQLLHTLKSVKEVAAEVGYDDELYFSRMFKKATGVAPTYFREFETAIRGGSNLSMLSG
jgi:AraC family transcriptional regulator, transcriptional activator of pobA